jgi:hypothetical protein
VDLLLRLEHPSILPVRSKHAKYFCPLTIFQPPARSLLSVSCLSFFVRFFLSLCLCSVFLFLCHSMTSDFLLFSLFPPFSLLISYVLLDYFSSIVAFLLFRFSYCLHYSFCWKVLMCCILAASHNRDKCVDCVSVSHGYLWGIQDWGLTLFNVYFPRETHTHTLLSLNHTRTIFNSMRNAILEDIFNVQEWWWWSCWWGEAASLNCGHQRAYCSYPRWYMIIETMVERYRQRKTPDLYTRSLWQSY